MIKDRIFIVTGGALGIGRCLVETLAGAGARVAFIDMNNEAGRELEARLSRRGDDVFFFSGDVGEERALEDFADSVVRRYGSVDCLVNNACLSRRGLASGCSFDDFNYVLRVGVSAPYLLTGLFLPHFNKGASVVNITSSRAFMSQPDTESYTAAKGGLTALTHAMAVSLSGRVRVNAIAPGWIDTGSCYDENYVPGHSTADRQQHPSGRIGEPADIARAVLFLCDERNGFINGETITIDGGMTRLMIYHGDQGWEYHGRD